MTCAQFKEELDRLDRANLSPALRKHVSECPSCALVYATLKTSLRLYTEPPSIGAADLVPRIMAALPFVRKPRRVMAMRNWLGAGVGLVLSIAFIPFLAEFKLLNTVYGPGYLVPLGIVLGLAITVYLMVFIATHVEEFSRRFGLHRHA